MSSLQLFSYNAQQVRTQLIDGEPWFVLADLCVILGLGSPHKVAERISEDDRNQTPVMDSLGRKQQTTIVNESGMYEVIIRSDKPEAKAFRRWLTSEVIPSIRKTGSYGTATKALSPDEIVAQALQITAARVQELTAKVEQDAPKVAYVEQFVAADDRVTFRALAGNLAVGEQKLRQLLVDRHWIYCETEQRWSNTAGKLETRNRYSAYSDKKPYFQNVLNHDAPRFKGGDVMHTLKITPAGAEAIARLVAKEATENDCI